MNRFDQSTPLFEEVVRLREAKLGRMHYDTQDSVANLGINYRDAGRMQQALPLLEEAYKSSQLNPSLEWVGHELLAAFVQAGDTRRATELVRELEAKARSNLPSTSAGLAKESTRLGEALIKLAALDDGERILRESLTIADKVEPDAWNTFHTRTVLAAILVAQKRFAEAEPLLLLGYEGMEQRKSSIPNSLRNNCLLEALARLVELYTAWDNPEKAAEWQKKLDELNSRTTSLGSSPKTSPRGIALVS